MRNEISCTPVLIVIVTQSRPIELSNILGLADQIFSGLRVMWVRSITKPIIRFVGGQSAHRRGCFPRQQ